MFCSRKCLTTIKVRCSNNQTVQNMIFSLCRSRSSVKFGAAHILFFNSLHTMNVRNSDDCRCLHPWKRLKAKSCLTIPGHSYSDSRKQTFERAFIRTEEKPVTVEKQLLNFMDLWKMDEAVKLLVTSLKDGYTPSGGIVLNLLQQLAHLGEVNNILELHDELLKDKNITREVKFYALLTEAYRNSGRVEEGIAMLRIVYHKTRHFNDIDPFFTMITIMVLRDFESCFYHVEGFVNDLMESDPPISGAIASLWKCLVLTEKFEQANTLLEENEELSKLISAQVSSIINAPFYVTYKKDIVLPWLLHLPQLKTPLWAATLEALVEHKCETDKWQEALDCLREAMTDGRTVKRSTLTLFLTNVLGQLSDSQVAELEAWAESLEEEDESESPREETENKDL